MKKFIKNGKWAFLLFAYVFSILSISPKQEIYAQALAECDTGADLESVEALSEDILVSSRLYELFFGKGK